MINDSSDDYDRIAAANLARGSDADRDHDEPAPASRAQAADSDGEHDEPAAANRARGSGSDGKHDELAAANLSRNKASGQSPGEIMREARRANDYTVEDLCAQTKLSRKAIHALEDNDFEALSQPVFARGYYRQCAKVLDIDSDRLIAAYAAWGGEGAPRAAAPTAVHVVPEDVTPPRWRAVGLIGGALVLLLAAGAVFLLMPDAERPNDRAGSNTVVLSSNASSTSPDTDTDTRGNSATGGSARGFDQAANPGTSPARAIPGDNAAVGLNSLSGIGDGNAAGADGSVPSGDTASVSGSSDAPSGGLNVNDALGRNADGRNADDGTNAEPPAAAEPAIAANHLTLSFSNRSWVDVRDADGARLLNGIYESGEKREFDGTAPYKITLGRAIAVDIRIGGEKVDVASDTASNGTARLTVNARGG